MAAKYQPLAAFLVGQGPGEVTLTLAEVEAILQQPLPGSAGLRWWWQSSRDAHTWRVAGWRARLDPRGRRVTFVRVPPATTGERLTTF
jgi:hypothetical protein